MLARAAGKLALGGKSGGSVDQFHSHQRLISIAVVPRADSELALAAAVTTSGHRVYLGSDARDPVIDVRLIASQLQLAALIDAAQPAGRDDVAPGLHKTDFAAAGGAGGAGAGAGAGVGAPKVQLSKAFCARGVQLLCAPYEGGANVFAVTREFSPAGASAGVAAFTETADLFECVEALPFGQARPAGRLEVCSWVNHECGGEIMRPPIPDIYSMTQQTISCRVSMAFFVMFSRST